MKERVQSAIVFSLVMLVGVFGGVWAFFALFAVVAGGAGWELLKLLGDGEQDRLRQWGGLKLGIWPLGVYVLSYASGIPLEGWWAPALLALPMLTALLMELFLGAAHPFRHVGNYLLALIYVGVPFALLADIAIEGGQYNAWRVLGLLLLNWMNDTFAYLTGYFMGRTPFFPRISPKKTWEGTMGGVVFTFLFAWGLSQYLDCYTLEEWLGAALVVATLGTLGDLVESMLKRSVGVKDSGAILPGHGGFLDRFDSFIFMLPFVWMVFRLLHQD